MATFSILVASTLELSKPLEVDSYQQIVARSIEKDYSIEDIIRIIHQHYPEIEIHDLRYVMMPIPKPQQEYKNVQIDQMAEAAADELGEFGGDFMEAPAETSERALHNIKASIDWALNYRMSPAEKAEAEECEGEDAQKVDCNDFGEDANRLLFEHDIPSSIISIWPKDPKQRVRESWHQFAHVRINKNTHLIIDNGSSVVVWEGSLEGFVASQMSNGTVEMEIMPVVGISHYVPPRYDNMISRGLVQLTHLVPHEVDTAIATRRESMRSFFVASGK